MTDFPNMTPEELQASMQADLYRFMTQECAGQTTAQTGESVRAYLADMQRHIEVTIDPLTYDQQRTSVTAHSQVIPKTAWGWLRVLEMQREAADARPIEFSVAVNEAPHSPPKRR